jgi:hypothetical protein
MQQASDCDMVLAHDDDLMMIDGLGHDTVSELSNSRRVVPSCSQSLETLKPEVMMDLLRRSNIAIQKDLCGELPTSINHSLILTGTSMRKELSPSDGGPNTNASIVKVAMPSIKSQNWSR